MLSINWWFWVWKSLWRPSIKQLFRYPISNITVRGWTSTWVSSYTQHASQLLRQKHVCPQAKSVFWLTECFDVLFKSTITILSFRATSSWQFLSHDAPWQFPPPSPRSWSHRLRWRVSKFNFCMCTNKQSLVWLSEEPNGCQLQCTLMGYIIKEHAFRVLYTLLRATREPKSVDCVQHTMLYTGQTKHL